MIRYAILIVVAMFMAVCAIDGNAQVHTDDIGVSLDANGKIVTSGGDWQGPYAGRVFEGILPSSSPFETDAPGFAGSVGTFSPNANVRLAAVKELLYWNGERLVPTASSMTLSYGSKSATITGTPLVDATGFDIPASNTGAFHRHVWYALDSSAADGLYGILLTLGPGAGATGFSSSDPFLIAFGKGDVLDMEGGINAMVNAAVVPEPSGVVLAALGAAGLAWARRGWRKHRPG